MNRSSATNVLEALRGFSPDALASALYDADDPQLLDHLAEALECASHRAAYYPREEVIAEADALLIEVLRWPIADALRPGTSPITASQLAELGNHSLDQAQRLLDNLAATETDAATRLTESGVHPDFTGEQSQVNRCIEEVLADGRVPTRASVRDHAMDLARRAMRPWWDGTQPLITHPTLPPRIISPSPATSVFAWLDRMESAPLGPDYIDERIAYLTDVRRAAGSAALVEGRTVGVRAGLRKGGEIFSTTKSSGGDPRELGRGSNALEHAWRRTSGAIPPTNGRDHCNVLGMGV